MLSFLVGMARAEVARTVAFYLAAHWALAVGACQTTDRPPPFADRLTPDREVGGKEGGLKLPPSGAGGNQPSPEGSVACGGERLRASIDLPNLYLVLDASGSMADPIQVSGVSKLTAARRSVGNLLREMGHKFRYGAMLFPASAESRNCSAGREVFPLTEGDPLGKRAPGQNGPVLQVLLNRLAGRSAGGPTPTAATLVELKTLLANEPGQSHVILVTDGAPNCNLEHSGCPSDRCIPDIEHAALGDAEGSICGVDLSCCDRGALGEWAAAQCIDDARTLLEVDALREASVPTYVIGMPGSSEYREVLERMAEAGGTARAGETSYYAVSDEPELMQALLEIGTGISIGCAIALESAPEDPELVNVYLDQNLVASDPNEGWEWTGPLELTLRGIACASLESGGVGQVEVVYGCRTVVR